MGRRRQTGEEIGKLIEAFPPEKLKDGRIILREEIEEAVGRRCTEYRYWTVVRRWKKIMESAYGVRVEAVYGVGFIIKALDEHGPNGI